MKKNILFCIIIGFFIYLPINAQTTKIDSLKIELGKAKEDTNKVNILLKISEEFYKQDFTKTRLNTNKAFALSKKTQFIQGQIDCYDFYGKMFFDEGDYPKALENFNKALELAKNQIKYDLSQIYVHLGNVFVRKTIYPKAISYYSKALKLIEVKNDQRAKAVILSNIAVVYSIQKDYTKALKYNKESLHPFKIAKDFRSIVNVNGNIAGIYLNINLNNKAIDICFKNISESQKINYGIGELRSYGYIGEAYFNLKDYNKSILYYLKSLKISKNINDQFGIAITSANLGKSYKFIQQYDKAIECFKNSNTFFIENDMLNEAKDTYLDLSEISELNKNYKQSLEYFHKYTTLKDSIYNETNSQQINEALTKYETEKKEKEIIVLNADLLSKKKDKVILEAKVQKRNSIIIGTITGSILLVITIILLYNRKRLLLRNLHQLEINQQRDNTTASIVQAQEKEQTRIAKDLHDSIGTFLSTLKINLQLYEEIIPENKSEGYQNALNLIDKISVELRNIMKNLSNETLQDQGLVKAFEEVVGRINELELTQVDFHTNGVISRLDESIEHNLYRISQELLNNCIKHAKAEHATIQLIEDDENITLMFEDDGVGFDVDSPILKNKNHGMGLKNIYNRVEFIKGTIRIESSSKNGSIFIIEVPKK